MQVSKQNLIGGLDEVGRGSIAGPLCIAVAVFPVDLLRIDGVDDSKKLSEKKRMELAPIIIRAASYIGLGWATPKFIDEYGITYAWQIAAERALKDTPDINLLLVDGIDCVRNYRGNQETVIKGDAKHWQIGAASIVAKVSRDVHMIDMAEHRPEYLWEQNKGYGTKKHREAILRHGVCSYHRLSFLKKNKEIYEKILRDERNQKGRTVNATWSIRK